MNKLIIYQGIQGSGKSTAAKAYVMEDPEHRIRWNQDDLRNMFGKYWVPSREHMLSPIKVAFLQEAMSKSYEVVIDDMNLNPKTLKWYEDHIKYYNELNPHNQYEIEYRKMNTPLETCLERDSKRENPIGYKVIVDTYNRYKETLESWNK